ncbi:MAG: ATP-dependent Clp protease proteolytic subunit [Patescibacteria group bacterium]|nr:ATP-dependent Clp protease proteolytic subunit [Patescibacteria group bacterium]MDE1944172.1 ATP-dependent Clp protease proteolytic subunit [Patescibacteria group bacterium]MDE1945444.1 ATP-dependent Clp protease proteolytic subunit [Patescibacteria group bacterium]MDE2057247.1 ATP-dependent Clp protease proteolytic subunit [Patescibacteria group bacterium]
MNEAIAEVAADETRGLPGLVAFAPDELVEYLGLVNYATSERVLKEIEDRLQASPAAPIRMVVTSAGGPSGTAMGFYDTVRTILRPAALTTIGAGDVDSSGILLLLTGSTRLVTAHTTGLLHLAGRYFDPNTRYTARDLRTMAAEDEAKDRQYAAIVAANTSGRLSATGVLRMMRRETLLAPTDFVRYGLAHAVVDEGSFPN